MIGTGNADNQALLAAETEQRRRQAGIPAVPVQEQPLSPYHEIPRPTAPVPVAGAEMPLMHDIPRPVNDADRMARAGTVPANLAGGAGAPAVPTGTPPRGVRPAARPGAGGARPAARPGGLSEADQLNQRELDRIAAAKGQQGPMGGVQAMDAGMGGAGGMGDMQALKEKKAALMQADQGGQGDRSLLQRLFGYSKGGLVRHQPRWDFGTKSDGGAGTNRYAKSKGR